MRVAGKSWTIVAAIAAVAVMVQVSMAQPGEGRRGGGPGRGMGGPTPVRLLMIEEVRDALKITGDQEGKLEDIGEQLREDMRAVFDEGGGREKIQELLAKSTEKVNGVLDEGQRKRLMGIFIQVEGARAALDPGVAKELGVTDEQKKSLGDVREKNREAMRDLFEGARDQEGGRGAIREKADKLREEEGKAMLAVLTSEQQKQLEELKGEKVEIDLSQLRGPGGPGGRFGDRPGGGGRGARNRDADSSSSDESKN